MAAGYRRGHVVYYMAASSQADKAMIPLGEVDGRLTPRLAQIGEVLATMEGFGADLRSDMDAWLKTHVALLMPSLAPAMRAAGRDNVRMSRTPDAMLLALRAIREGFRVVRALGLPVVPHSVRIFERLPEPLLVWGFRKRIADPRMRIAMLEHAQAAQDEIKHLADEFISLARQANVPTPVIDALYAYFDPATPPLPEGSARLPMDWRFLWAAVGALAGMLVLLRLIVGLSTKRTIKKYPKKR
jgi:2-dehydropantoate 2-reductase